MKPNDFTYADLLARNGLQRGHALAVRCGTEQRSYADLWQRSHVIARKLSACQVGVGDRIGLLSGNRTEVLELLGAAALVGAIVMCLNTRSSAAEISSIIADTRPRLLLSEPEQEPLLKQIDAELPCYAITGTAGRLLPWPTPTSEDTYPIWKPLSASHPLVAIPTAAVDGRPRLALLSHRALITQGIQLSSTWKLSTTDRHLCVLPLFHTAGLSLAIAAQVAGAANVIMPRFDATEAVRLIYEEQVSFFASFSPMLGAILDAAKDADELTSLRAVCGLESPDTIFRFESYCPKARFWTGYGQTETSGMISLAPAQERPGSAGLALPTIAIRIELASGDVASTDQSGEILVRGPCVFEQYWNRPNDTAHTARNGWHHTGDSGRLDADGYLWFEGSLPEKRLIKSGGENIYPAEVEGALCSHPAVAQAVVFGVTDERWGEAVRAICLIKQGATVTADELDAHVSTRIARFKRPRDIVFADMLPHMPDGSLDRDAIQHKYG